MLAIAVARQMIHVRVLISFQQPTFQTNTQSIVIVCSKHVVVRLFQVKL